jgi:hypothetical protein
VYQFDEGTVGVIQLAYELTDKSAARSRYRQGLARGLDLTASSRFRLA